MILDEDSFGFWSKIVRTVFKAVFRRIEPAHAVKLIEETLAGAREAAVYIHIPFCSGTCLFCPYTRYPIPRSEVERVFEKYFSALKREIDIYARIVEELSIRIVDAHAGGGTPSLAPPKMLRDLIEHLSSRFGAQRFLAIEANPEDLAIEERVWSIVDAGVQEVSLGLQSLSPRKLRVLGRRHSVEDGLRAVENLRRAGCRRLNIDLMYATPGETVSEWVEDLEKASSLDVDEITCYPTLVPKSVHGHRLLKERRLPPQPDLATVDRMALLCEDILSSKGFAGVEIYGYSRSPDWKYFTVNYEMEGPLIGLGCGAMGFTGGFEWVNTCSVDAYIESVNSGRAPIAGARLVDVRERAARVVASRLFVSRRLDLHEFRSIVGQSLEEALGRSMTMVIRMLRLIGAVKRVGGSLVLTRRGYRIAHRFCWAFVLNVPCAITAKFMESPWPTEVRVP